MTKNPEIPRKKTTEEQLKQLREEMDPRQSVEQLVQAMQNPETSRALEDMQKRKDIPEELQEKAKLAVETRYDMLEMLKKLDADQGKNLSMAA